MKERRSVWTEEKGNVWREEGTRARMKYKKECVDRGRKMCRLRREKKTKAVYGLMERRNVRMKEGRYV